jgi:hypothetical protein
MAIHFVSFADTGYRGTLERIKQEAMGSGFFDFVHILTEMDLDSSFLHRNENFIKNNKRGYGYWIWKPQVCLQIFDKMNDGDILVYADAGCTISKQGKANFDSYINMCRSTGSVNFIMRFKEKHWCRGDLFNHLLAHKFSDTGQIHATTFMLLKNEKNVNVVKEWLSTCEIYPLVDDSKSKHPNYLGFKEHRHDQAIFSLLRKRYGFVCIPDVVENRNPTIPIAATRKKF